jgi:hypothetical protein
LWCMLFSLGIVRLWQHGKVSSEAEFFQSSFPVTAPPAIAYR